MSQIPLDSSHPDYSVLAPIADAILLAGGGLDTFRQTVTTLFRQAIDEVIDAPRTNRFTIDEIEKTEKTYIGTKVEILLRNFLGMAKGKVLDLSVGGEEVDIKMTTLRDWMIPRESIGLPAVLMRANEKRALCDVGLVVCHRQYMRNSSNQDSKGQIAAAQYVNIWWILRDTPYPSNFWEVLPISDRASIMGAGGGRNRVAALFKRIQRQPISRSQVQAIGQQLDYMKRIRKNGGARDLLRPQGIAILWGEKDRALIKALNLGPVSSDEFISVTPANDAEVNLLRMADHLD